MTDTAAEPRVPFVALGLHPESHRLVQAQLDAATSPRAIWTVVIVGLAAFGTVLIVGLSLAILAVLRRDLDFAIFAIPTLVIGGIGTAMQLRNLTFMKRAAPTS